MCSHLNDVNKEFNASGKFEDTKVALIWSHSPHSSPIALITALMVAAIIPVEVLLKVIQNWVNPWEKSWCQQRINLRNTLSNGILVSPAVCIFQLVMSLSLKYDWSLEDTAPAMWCKCSWGNRNDWAWLYREIQEKWSRYTVLTHYATFYVLYSI